MKKSQATLGSLVPPPSSLQQEEEEGEVRLDWLADWRWQWE